VLAVHVTTASADTVTETLHATATFQGLPWDYTYSESYSGGAAASSPGATYPKMTVKAGQPFGFTWTMTEKADVYCAGGSSTVAELVQQGDPWIFLPAYSPRGVGIAPPSNSASITFMVAAHKKWWVDANPQPPCYQHTRMDFTVDGSQTRSLRGCYVMQEPFERDSPGARQLQGITNVGTLPQVCFEATGSGTGSEGATPSPASTNHSGLLGRAFRVGAARAGRPFTVSLTVTRAGKAVRGAVSCVAKLNGASLPITRLVVKTGGVASCTWSLPRSAGGKRLTGSIAESYHGERVSRLFSVGVA
jgi:hypothetical protein